MKWLRGFTKIFIGFFLLLFALFKTPKKVHYKQEEFYHRTVATIDSVITVVPWQDVATWKVGWGEAHIVPSSPVEFAGYGRKGTFEFVADSTTVKVLLLSSDSFNVLFISYDILIISPLLKNAVSRAIQEQFPSLQHLYFTASHTHKSFGGWSEDLAGKLLLGGHQPAIIQQLTTQTIVALQQAFATLETVRLHYKTIEAGEWVKNRLDEQRYEDAYLRILVMEKQQGKKGLLATFSAHATCLSSRFKGLSGDYPALVSRQLVQKGYDFAMVVAGAVGSHAPTTKDGSYESLVAYARGLAEQLDKNPTDSISFSHLQKVRFAEIPIYLPEPQWRIALHLSTRSWVFHALFAHTPQNPFITYFQLGELVFLGMPCDFSGELYPSLATNPNSLIITSFNGSYTGYFSHPDHYYRNHPETRDMNWYGETASWYLVEIINHLLQSTR